MSLPTEKELKSLEDNGYYVQLLDIEHNRRVNSEGFHDQFDELLEAKLDSLDPEWMDAMRKAYRDSGAERWYA